MLFVEKWAFLCFFFVYWLFRTIVEKKYHHHNLEYRKNKVTRSPHISHPHWIKKEIILYLYTPIISFIVFFNIFKSTWIATRVGYVSLYISKNQHCTFTAYKFYFLLFLSPHPKLFRAHSFRYTSFLCHFNQNDIGNFGWFPST